MIRFEKWIYNLCGFKCKTGSFVWCLVRYKEHTNFTGSSAKINPKVGGKFTAWDGYITGKTIELDLNKRILQNWRTTDFPEETPDSKVELIFVNVDKGTKLILSILIFLQVRQMNIKKAGKIFILILWKNIILNSFQFYEES